VNWELTSRHHSRNSGLAAAASGRVDHWQNFDAFAPPRPAKPVGAAPLPDRANLFPPALSSDKVTTNLSLTASGYRAFRAPTLNNSTAVFARATCLRSSTRTPAPNA